MYRALAVVLLVHVFLLASFVYLTDPRPKAGTVECYRQQSMYMTTPFDPLTPAVPLADRVAVLCKTKYM